MNPAREIMVSLKSIFKNGADGKTGNLNTAVITKAAAHNIPHAAIRFAESFFIISSKKINPKKLRVNRKTPPKRRRLILLLSSGLSRLVSESHRIGKFEFVRGLYRQSGITPCPEAIHKLLYYYIPYLRICQ